MSSNLRAFLTAMAIAIAVYFFLAHPSGGLNVGEAAPDFSLSNASGDQQRLSDFKGQWVLVHFWATWCGTCQKEMPAFNQLAEALKGRVVILGLSLDDSGRGNGWKAIDSYKKTQALNFTVLMDSKGAVADLYGTYALPETYLVDPKGQIVEKWQGAQEWGQELAHIDQRISNNPKK